MRSSNFGGGGWGGRGVTAEVLKSEVNVLRLVHVETKVCLAYVVRHLVSQD